MDIAFPNLLLCVVPMYHNSACVWCTAKKISEISEF